MNQRPSSTYEPTSAVGALLSSHVNISAPSDWGAAAEATFKEPRFHLHGSIVKFRKWAVLRGGEALLSGWLFRAGRCSKCGGGSLAGPLGFSCFFLLLPEEGPVVAEEGTGLFRFVPAPARRTVSSPRVAEPQCARPSPPSASPLVRALRRSI